MGLDLAGAAISPGVVTEKEVKMEVEMVEVKMEVGMVEVEMVEVMVEVEQVDGVDGVAEEEKGGEEGGVVMVGGEVVKVGCLGMVVVGMVGSIEVVVEVERGWAVRAMAVVRR